MYKKYTIPLSIFVVFENTNPIAWTSESFYPNSYLLYLNKSWLYGINLFFKNEVFFSNSTLCENSAFDNKNNFFFSKKFKLLSSNRIILFYNYYFYSTKTRIVCISTYNNSSKIASLDKIYKSASWLEREVGEMFKISYFFKIDSRRLLLDYSKQENPLLKDFPVEGFNDVFYNFFEDQVVCYNYSSVVEL